MGRFAKAWNDMTLNYFFVGLWTALVQKINAFYDHHDYTKYAKTLEKIHVLQYLLTFIFGITLKSIELTWKSLLFN